MLPKPNRLPAREPFVHSQTATTPYFRVLIKLNEFTYNRFGFVVSKKIDKRAVVRNRLKRVLRESVHDVLEANLGKDVLFIVRKSFFDVPTQEITTMVKEVLERYL